MFLRVAFAVAALLFAGVQASESCKNLEKTPCGGKVYCQWANQNCQEKCFVPNTRYDGDNLNMKDGSSERTDQDTIEMCQAHCESKNGCTRFSWWKNGGCHITDTTVARISENDVFTGIPGCTDPCGFKIGKKFTPNMKDVDRIETDTPELCQRKCLETSQCAHFSWWLNKGCQLQDDKATEEADSSVIAGRPTCLAETMECKQRDEGLCVGVCRWDDVAGKCNDVCWHANVKYEPLDFDGGPARETVSNIDDCQKKCKTTKECAHFTFFSKDAGCHLQDIHATKKTNDGSTAGDPICLATCFKSNSKFTPDMSSEMKTSTESPEACRHKCGNTGGCTHWSWWLNKDCRLQDDEAKESKESGAVSGPATCSAGSQPDDTFPTSAPTPAPATASSASTTGGSPNFGSDADTAAPTWAPTTAAPTTAAPTSDPGTTKPPIAGLQENHGQVSITVNDPVAFCNDPVAQQQVANAFAEATGVPSAQARISSCSAARRLEAESGDQAPSQGRRLAGTVNLGVDVGAPAGQSGQLNQALNGIPIDQLQAAINAHTGGNGGVTLSNLGHFSGNTFVPATLAPVQSGFESMPASLGPATQLGRVNAVSSLFSQYLVSPFLHATTATLAAVAVAFATITASIAAMYYVRQANQGEDSVPEAQQQQAILASPDTE